MPVCKYEILDGGPSGQPIQFAVIGQQVSTFQPNSIWITKIGLSQMDLWLRDYRHILRRGAQLHGRRWQRWHRADSWRWRMCPRSILAQQSRIPDWPHGWSGSARLQIRGQVTAILSMPDQHHNQGMHFEISLKVVWSITSMESNSCFFCEEEVNFGFLRVTFVRRYLVFYYFKIYLCIPTHHLGSKIFKFLYMNFT